MKIIKEDVNLINEEYLIEMARVGFIDKNKLEIYVRTNDAGKIPHFHIWDTSTRGDKLHSCIKIEVPEYFPHEGKEDVLNAKQIKDLLKFLKTPPLKTTRYDNNWQVLLDMWNLNNSDINVDTNLEIPDYNLLK